MNLTPEEKRARLFLKGLTNKIKSDFSFKKIHTRGDYLLALGNSPDEIRNRLHYRDNELEQPLSFSELKSLLEDERIKLETEQWLRHNPPKTNHEEVNIDRLSKDSTLQQFTSSHRTDTNKEEQEELPPSPKEKAFLYGFQKKNAKALLDGIQKEDLRSQLLIANAGLGKTFILGAAVRRLLDNNFHIGKTISPWPYMYITKASVVEQTKRVLENWFGIDTIRECFVTNYDQLRATLGTMYITEKTIVEDGYEHITYEWRPMINPCVFIIDECQAAKNEDSLQSKIIQAIAKIQTPVYCIFSSATPATRVSEFKYFVLNTKMNWKI